VGATIVEREYLTFVPAKQHPTIGSVHCHHLLFVQVGERCGADGSCKIRRNAKGSHSQEDNRSIVQREAKARCLRSRQLGRRGGDQKNDAGQSGFTMPFTPRTVRDASSTRSEISSKPLP
jgi:hypothetical protein